MPSGIGAGQHVLSKRSYTHELPRRGQAAASVRARPRFVLYALLKQTPVLMAMTAPPAVAAAVDGEASLAFALIAPTVLLGGVALVSRKLSLDRELRRIEALAALALLFVAATVILVPAFLALEMTWLDATFESASGITSTGLTVSREAENWPVSAHFLRAWSQWCGGLAIAIAGVALLMDSSRAAQVMGNQSVGGTDYLASTRAKARLVLLWYVLITAVGIAISVPLFPGWWEGPVVVLAAVSTGGFTPRADSLADYNMAAQVFTMMLCIATTVSLLFYALAWRRGLRHAVGQGTVKAVLIIIVAGTLANVGLNAWLNGWDANALIDGALNHVSAQTTAGFSVAPIAPASPLLFLLIAAMILGGDVGSTTGGLKTGRTTLLSRMIALVFLRLRLPDRAVSHLKIGEKRADAEAILLAAALLAIYLIAAGIFWMALYAAGYPALPSLFDAVSALSTVGHSAGVIGPDLEPYLKALTVVAMLLGRLEFFALLILILPSTWIARS